MITRLRVKNFLSLREVDLPLGQRNILVGPNMSGKSNLVESLRFLTSIAASGANQAFLDRGGFHEVLWKGGTENRITLALTCEVPAESEQDRRGYDYEISFVGGATGAFDVEHERLILRVGGSTAKLVDARAGQGEFLHEDGTPAIKTSIDSNRSVLELNVPGWAVTTFKTYVALWHFYKLIPTLMRQPNAVKEQFFLSQTGDNLSAWLLTLQTAHSQQFNRLKQVALDTLPSLEDVFAPPTQLGTTILSSREKHLSRSVNIWRMSDGELTFLALLSLIFVPDSLGSPVVCLEEPENHLHPKLLETLVDVYEQRRQEVGPRRAQLIVTTHSPYLIDRMSLDDIVVTEKHEGATVCRKPASKQHLQELLARNELGLGDLWYSGALSEP
ncbi:AAA family ATPase [Nitrospira sp. Kam-Ns4a]